MTSTPDPVLLEARDLARAALGEITDPQTIGSDDGHEVHEAHVLTLFFECRLPGYPGWRWAATVARVDEDSPVNVLEAELLPGAGAVVALEWVPWSERLAQYREAQAQQAEEEAAKKAAAEAAVSDEEDADIDAEEDLDDIDIDEAGFEEDDDDELDLDDDGFADLDEHDLHDDDDDDVDELDDPDDAVIDDDDDDDDD